ncbi:MAG: hypothetical protein ACRDAP_01585, partial [Shewanella sp.]
LILQAKFGSTNSLSSSYGTWAQSGFQINVISRGLNYRYPIFQLFVHNEMGFFAEAGAMGVLNTGINLVPNENGEYSASYMVENVQRVDTSWPLAQSRTAGINVDSNVSIGYDSLDHSYWQGARGIAAGVLTTGAQIIGSVLGGLAGHAIDTANEVIAGVADATSVPTTSSAASSTISNFTSAAPTAPRVFRFTDLMTSAGAFLATNGMVNALTATRVLSPTSTLHMSEVTLGVGDTFLNIPIGETGETLTLTALPRFNLTRGEFNQMAPTPLVANSRAQPPRNDVEQSDDQNGDDVVVMNQTAL